MMEFTIRTQKSAGLLVHFENETYLLRQLPTLCEELEPTATLWVVHRVGYLPGIPRVFTGVCHTGVCVGIVGIAFENT